MNASRTIDRLLWCYPASWRARYGRELETLIMDMSGGRRVPWRVRADVLGAAGRERMRSAGLSGDVPGPERVRSGAVLVMWAWALFVLGGAVLGKSTEHWQSAMPAGSAHGTASAAFTTLIAVAVVAGLLVLTGIGLTLPSLRLLLRGGGWRQIRTRVLSAVGLTAVVIAATIGLAVWAHGLTPPARNGHDTAYGIAFVAWAALCAATLVAWTAAAARTARHLHLTAGTLRLLARLAAAATGAMAVIAVATAVWWGVVASASPAALTGAPAVSHQSAFVWQLVVAIAIMLFAIGLGVLGTRRAVRALPCLEQG
jgi:MFS family permease